MAGLAIHPPETLIKALALGWSLAFSDRATTLVLQGPPRRRGRALRGDDWLVTFPHRPTLTGFETISRIATACNHGILLSLPMDAASPRLFARRDGCIALTTRREQKLPGLPPGHRLVGLCMSPRAGSLGHPFPDTLPRHWRDRRRVAETAIRCGQPLPAGLPPNLLRCLLRDLATAAPGPNVTELARLHDRPLYRALSG